MVVGVQESKGYGIGFGIPTIFFGVAILAFIMGAVFKLYTCIPAEGSPFTRIFRVLKGGCQTLGRSGGVLAAVVNGARASAF